MGSAKKVAGGGGGGGGGGGVHQHPLQGGGVELSRRDNQDNGFGNSPARKVSILRNTNGSQDIWKSYS